MEAGRFYGWPYFAGDARGQDGDPPEQPVDPIATSGGSTMWAPAGLAVDETGDGPRSLLVANLRGEQLLRLVLGEDPRTVARTEVALDGVGRVRAAGFGPDGCLYLTTSNRDGRGSPRQSDDRLFRVCRG